MFEPKNCLGGAVGVFLIAGAWFHSAWAGLLFAAFPMAFFFAGLRTNGRR